MTRPFTVALPDDLADLVEAKIASGDYADESEIVRDGLALLQERDAAFERWLREEVAAAYDEDLANPQAAIPAEEIMARLQERRRVRLMKSGAE